MDGFIYFDLQPVLDEIPDTDLFIFFKGEACGYEASGYHQSVVFAAAPLLEDECKGIKFDGVKYDALMLWGEDREAAYLVIESMYDPDESDLFEGSDFVNCINVLKLAERWEMKSLQEATRRTLEKITMFFQDPHWVAEVIDELRALGEPEDLELADRIEMKRMPQLLLGPYRDKLSDENVQKFLASVGVETDGNVFSSKKVVLKDGVPTEVNPPPARKKTTPSPSKPTIAFEATVNPHQTIANEEEATPKSGPPLKRRRFSDEESKSILMAELPIRQFKVKVVAVDAAGAAK